MLGVDTETGIGSSFVIFFGGGVCKGGAGVWTDDGSGRFVAVFGSRRRKPGDEGRDGEKSRRGKSELLCDLGRAARSVVETWEAEGGKRKGSERT
jgi:hypothetical protein